MNEANCISLSGLETEHSPFRYFSSTRIFNNGLEETLFDWFEQTEDWGLTEADFYTQYEISLLEVDLPQPLQCLINEATISAIAEVFVRSFDTSSLELVGVTAHKLVNGHRMGVHNDFIGPEETHRLIIQISPKWHDSNGGYLMFFNSNDPKDVAKVIRPLDNTGIGFEISQYSFHAVSTVYNFCRYTLVYTFKLVGS